MSAQVHEMEPAPERFDLAVETFKLLGDSTRLRILWALQHGDHSVGDLAAHLGAQTPAVSQHLAKLRAARLVRVRKDGNRVFYGVDNTHVQRLIEEALFHTDHLVGAAGSHGPRTPGGRGA